MAHHNVMLMTLKQNTLKELISLQERHWGPGRANRFKKESPSLSVASVWEPSNSATQLLPALPGPQHWLFHHWT